MKKTYIIPATKIVSTLMMNMIAESPLGLSSTAASHDGTDYSNSLSKEENFWGDEEW